MKVKVGIYSYLAKDRACWRYKAHVMFIGPMDHLCVHEVEVERKGLAKPAAIAEHKTKCMKERQS